MLKHLHLENVGPAPVMDLRLAPRLNLITGDNGLGKSFLLDAVWWALTRRWPRQINSKLTSGYPARPTDPHKPARIGFTLDSKSKILEYISTYSVSDQTWTGRSGRPWNPGLVIYAHAEGGFSVWDPARNYWKKSGNLDVQERLPGYVFSPQEVWDGLFAEVGGERTKVCRGLIDDWALWIARNDDDAFLMAVLVRSLTPGTEQMEPGPLLRLSVDDARDIPSIRTKYAEAVPVTFASSGVRRMLGLAYMLMWSWSEHVKACALRGMQETNRVIVLFDELESHLHPRWQRSILKSLMFIMEALHTNASVQLIAATHSPLILASAEPLFDADQDTWWDLDFNPDSHQVELTQRPFVRKGTAGRWLMSDAFDLASEGRSLEAEQALAVAEDLLRRRREGDSPSLEEWEKANQGLQATLTDIDGFWMRWSEAFEQLKAGAAER